MSRILFLTVLVSLSWIAFSRAKYSEEFRQSIAGHYSAQYPEREYKNETYKINDGKAVLVADGFYGEKPTNDAHNGENNPHGELERRTTEAEESMARGTWVGAYWTAAGSILLILALLATLCQNKKLAETNKIMREQHAAERRPWLSIELKISTPFIRADIKTTEGTKDGYGIEIIYTAKNHGNTPAMNVVFHAKPRIIPDGDQTKILPLLKEFSTECRAKNLPGEVIFPDSQREIKFMAAFPKDTIPRTANTEVFTRILYGVVQYSSRGVDTQHQTPFSYMIGETINLSGGVVIIVNDRLDIDWSLKTVGLLPAVCLEAD